MRRTALALFAVAVAAAAACGREADTGPSRSQRACEQITMLTPGTVEMAWNTKVTADPNATQKQKADALKSTLDLLSSDASSAPYTCSGPVFERYLAEFEG